MGILWSYRISSVFNYTREQFFNNCKALGLCKKQRQHPTTNSNPYTAVACWVSFVSWSFPTEEVTVFLDHWRVDPMLPLWSLTGNNFQKQNIVNRVLKFEFRRYKWRGHAHGHTRGCIFYFPNDTPCSVLDIHWFLFLFFRVCILHYTQIAP